MPSARLLPPISSESVSDVTGTLLSFRKLLDRSPDQEKTIDATDRLLDDLGNAVTCFALERDSPLAPLLLWDVAHRLPLDGRIHLIGPDAGSSFLDRDYFRAAFSVSASADGRVFRKIAALPAEADHGLDRWTFGIPVGPDDATLLNAVVARILEIDIPHKEIILAGRPGANFEYWDQVRLVGEDLPPPPPINLSLKKNRLAQEARFENLCLFHDRVMLPRDFGTAIRRFGDDYPLVAFQSVYFDDKWGLIPRRYSDLNMLVRPLNQSIIGVGRSDLNPTTFAPSLFMKVEESGFVCSHARRYNLDRGYVNGSLCISKRSVWNSCTQNEGLHWTEFEDVEHGLRACALGIPSRCNPYAFTQSLVGRSGFSFGGTVASEHVNGSVGSVRLPTEVLPVPRKPLLRISQTDAQAKLEAFTRSYAPANVEISRGADLRGRAGVQARLEAVINATYAAVVPYRLSACRKFLADFERLVLLDQISYGKKQYITEQLAIHQERGKVNLIDHSAELTNMVAQRPRGPLFFTELSDYLPRASWHWRVTLFISALMLWLTHGRYLYHPDGLRGYLAALRESLPSMISQPPDSSRRNV